MDTGNDQDHSGDGDRHKVPGLQQQTGTPVSDAGQHGSSETRQIAWREDGMATHFANVVNVQGTREQVDLFFGTNRTWNVSAADEVVVDLSNRIILTPLAAKRLHAVLGGVLSEYENRHGRLDVEA